MAPPKSPSRRTSQRSHQSPARASGSASGTKSIAGSPKATRPPTGKTARKKITPTMREVPSVSQVREYERKWMIYFRAQLAKEYMKRTKDMEKIVVDFIG